MRNKLAISFLAGIAALAAACTATGGSPTSTEAPSAPSTTMSPVTGSTTAEHDVDVVGCDDPEDDVAVFCEAYDLIKTRYVDFIDDATLADAAGLGLADLDGASGSELLVCAAPTDDFDSTCDLAAMEADDSTEAAEAMVAGLAAYALDANSAYFDPETLALVEEEQQGEIEGIGALVSSEDETIPGDNKQCSVVSDTCQILIVSTIQGAPAEAAGLMRDDAIVGVDGSSILGWTVDEVTTAVRGPAGSEVRLTMERDGETFDVDITRAAVMIPVIEKEVVGDVGYVDADGYLYLTDRKANMIISGGVNIYPAEIESTLQGHPKIADVAVFGIPHADWGEEVKAVIQPVDGVAGDDALRSEILAWAADKLAKYKTPRSIDFVEDMPRDPNGKLYKRKLRDPYWEGRERAI